MDVLFLSRMQFAIVTVYHFFFVPLTLGLSIMVAIMETQYVRTGDESYKRMTKYWGTLFLINFAMGVVTGIVQEFQFGMNWSEYSRFVGDIFGAPLAIEALVAFFLESTFLGLWVFGWEKLSKRQHLATIWLVAIGSNMSAFWILVANSWMQQPVGYAIDGNRAVMTDFLAVITSGHVWAQFPHTVLSGMVTAGFFILGVSSWHLLRKSQPAAIYLRSWKMGLVYAAVATLLVILSGHTQAQYMVKIQPMKMAAAEALWDTEQPAALSLFTIGDSKNRQDVFAIRIPMALSLLSCNNLTCEVEGINDLQAEYESKYGAGDYVPWVFAIYWTFRGMLTTGFAMLGLAALGLFLWYRKSKIADQRLVLKALVYAIALPYIANSMGWLMTELGRQPWIVFGMMKTADGVSVVTSVFAVVVTLVGFTLLYGALMVADVYLLTKYAKLGMEADPKSSKKRTASPRPVGAH